MIQPIPAEEIEALEQQAFVALSAELPAAIELRQRMHRDPRLGGEEQPSRDLLRDALGLPGTDLTEGFWVRVGPDDGPAVGIRAELDALPIQEESGVAWASERPGIAHLCGHDVHAAALVATTRVLAPLPLPVPLISVFQPREEIIPSGALDFVHDGGLLGQGIRAMMGVHLQPVIPVGAVSAAAGAINAAADNFEITVFGVPAHGAYPHLSRDPIVAAAAVVQGLQHLVSRRVDPMSPAVVTVGKIEGGDSHNQIPSRVSLYGTTRSFSEHERLQLHRALREVAQAISGAHGCTADVSIELGEPVLHNNAELALYVSRALEHDGFVTSTPVRSCGADDFAFYGSRFPSLMIFAGVGDSRTGSPGLHHPRFVPPDGTVGEVARIMLLAYFAAARDLLS